MIVYTFIFMDEDGQKTEHDIWADFEAQAWQKADSYAYNGGYVDYYLKED